MASSSEGGVRLGPPPCGPTPFGLNSAAAVQRTEDVSWMLGAEWDEPNCDYRPRAITPCVEAPDGTMVPDRGFDTKFATPWAAYAGWSCSPGSVVSEAWDRASALLESGLWWLIERTYWTGKDQDGNDILGGLQGPGLVNLTPSGGPAGPVSGVGILEEYMSGCTTCAPVLHLTPKAATWFGGHGLYRTDFQGGTAALHTGTQVVIGRGYDRTGPGGLVAAQNEAWIYMAGGAAVTIGPEFFNPERGNRGAAVNRENNDAEVFAKRFVVTQTACCRAAVKITLT